MALYQLVYLSRASKPFNDEQLMALLEKAKEFNGSVQITGMLLHRYDVFLQLLEGPVEAVQKLYKKISADPRHNQVHCLYQSVSDKRIFEHWTMDFFRPENLSTEEQKIVGDFIDRAFKSQGTPSDSKEVLQIMNRFRKLRNQA